MAYKEKKRLPVTRPSCFLSEHKPIHKKRASNLSSVTNGEVVKDHNYLLRTVSPALMAVSRNFNICRVTTALTIYGLTTLSLLYTYNIKPPIAKMLISSASPKFDDLGANKTGNGLQETLSFMNSTIYAITPTYKRWTQKADLTRLLQTLLNVPNFHWIVVEDSLVKTKLVSNLLKESGLSYTHLNKRTDIVALKQSTKKYKGKPSRGVDQRNAGLAWIRKTVPRNSSGVVYFMDDDNTYSLKVFEEMRSTKVVSCWLVGFLATWLLEGPGKCKDGKVLSWFIHWHNDREFPLDMAAFAINIKLIFEHLQSKFLHTWPPGNLESKFLASLNLTINDMEGKANCTKVLAWHTKTLNPGLDKSAVKLYDQVSHVSKEEVEV